MGQLIKAFDKPSEVVGHTHKDADVMVELRRWLLVKRFGILRVDVYSLCINHMLEAGPRRLVERALLQRRTELVFFQSSLNFPYQLYMRLLVLIVSQQQVTDEAQYTLYWPSNQTRYRYLV